MTNLGVADLTIRQANRQSRRVKDRSEALSRQTIQVWSIRKRDRVAIASRGYSPPIENDENYRANLCAKLGSRWGRDAFQVHHGANLSRASDRDFVRIRS
jgi:hypothetical protein